MKKLSRWQKLLLCIPFLVFSLLLIASLSRWPSPTLEAAIRRKERQQLVGPSELIGHITYDHGRVCLGKTAYGWITFEYTDDLGWDHAELRYFPKTEGFTMFCTDFMLRSGSEDWLPIFVFTDFKNAVSAEMTLSVQGTRDTALYQLTAEKTPGGYFLFSLPGKELSTECFWLLQQSIANACQEYDLTGTVEIRVGFRDASGNLLDTCTQTVTK